MAKPKTIYRCTECGYESAKWNGKCPSCGAWNTLEEDVPLPAQAVGNSRRKPVDLSDKIQELDEVDTTADVRYHTGVGELDRVLGGGLVRGSIVLLGGEPGIGKSTLLLQICQYFGESHSVLYVSGEESAKQIKLRAQRLGVTTRSLYLLTVTDAQSICDTISASRPDIVIIDSIQTMYNSELETAAGSVGQVRECTAKLLNFAKESNIAIIIIGHVTKEGNIAGPRLLEHMVDVVLQFEGDRSYTYRVLRALKNRFGSTSECGIFSMEAEGLQEVSNPSGLFLETKEKPVPGSVITATIEGNRPILAEIQALAAHTPFGMPRRTAVGVDYNRVNMLIAILEKRMGMNFGDQDAYVSAVGGMKITEPAVDLAIVGALVSSYRNVPVGAGILCLGEVGLTGELRRVGLTDRRIKEAAQLGFKRFIVPRGSFMNGKKAPAGVVECRTVEEAIGAMFR